MGRKIHAKVPLRLNGLPKGVRDGGILEHSIHEVEVECDTEHLPESIEVDISNLEANHALHMRDISIPEGVRLLTNPDTVIAIIKFAHGEAEAAPKAEEVPSAEGKEQAAAEEANESAEK